MVKIHLCHLNNDIYKISTPHLSKFLEEETFALKIYSFSYF